MTVRAINLAELTHLNVRASEAQALVWRGRRALKLNGLALVCDLEVGDATIEVDIWAEGSCYPGIAFRVADVLNYELAYAAPHCSGLWDAVQPKLLLGENVAQAAQFASSGNADGGIVAYSLALAPALRERGTFALLPETLHAPLRQRMVLLEQASPAAERFYDYLRSPASRAILREYGFVLPEN